MAWSPDGRRVVSGSLDQTVQVWDAVGGDSVASSGAKLLTYREHSSFVQAVAWSPDGRRVVSGSHDGTVQVRDATSGATLLTYSGHSSPVHAVAWSPDGKRIASAGYGVQVWQAG